ncbi:MAG: hypothetical protein LBU91_08250 [Bacteroidales bacterium]|jgi:hypothetical protein|nr:hypothetical protein [Bacteroidales bacterium]
MAKSKNNVLTHGLSGKIGDLLVFYERNGKTIVAKRPTVNWERSEKQKEHCCRFQKASHYAKIAQHEEIYINAAAKQGRRPYNLALTDAFHVPEIEKIDHSNYSGKVNDKIIITVTDNFQVKEVTVRIINSNNLLVEEGKATPSKIDDEWIYIATKVNNKQIGCRIEVLASDIPGNISLFEKGL